MVLLSSLSAWVVKPSSTRGSNCYSNRWKHFGVKGRMVAPRNKLLNFFLCHHVYMSLLIAYWAHLCEWIKDKNTSLYNPSPRLAEYENSPSKLSLSDSQSPLTQTQRELAHSSEPATIRVKRHTRCVQLFKLLRAVCLFLLRPDCDPPRQCRLVEVVRESKIKTAQMVQYEVIACSAPRQGSSQQTQSWHFFFFLLSQPSSHILELHGWTPQSCSICELPVMVL